MIWCIAHGSHMGGRDSTSVSLYSVSPATSPPPHIPIGNKLSLFMDDALAGLRLQAPGRRGPLR